MQYIIYIALPINKVVLDKYMRAILVKLITQRRWQTSWYVQWVKENLYKRFKIDGDRANVRSNNSAFQIRHKLIYLL